MTDQPTDEIVIRQATVADVPHVQTMIAPYVEARQLIPRTAEELEKLTENGFTAELAGRIVGFSAVDIYSRKLAEIQCLAVSADCRGQGVGRRLIEHCVARARENGVFELMAITSTDQLFQACGFDYSLPNQRRALFIHPNEPPVEE